MSLPLADISFFIHGRATKPALLTFLNPCCKTKKKKTARENQELQHLLIGYHAFILHGKSQSLSCFNGHELLCRSYCLV